MDKNKILDYVMKTPYNTNIAILDSMIMSLLAENKVADSAESLSNALAEGKDVILTADIETISPVVVKAESKLDLNKKSIKAQDNSSEYYMIKAEGDGAIVTISGNGIISAGASQQAIPVTAANGGKVIIKDGTYLCKGQMQCVYANGGKVEIYGGTYGTVSGESVKDLLNVQNTHEVTDIQVYGGRFIGRDPALGDDALGGTFVAPGYKSVEVVSGIFEVVKE